MRILFWGKRLESNLYYSQFISVHARRDDFQNWCGEFTKEECFASLSVIGRRVDEVKAEVLQQKGVAVNHVIITSDERDDAWWDQVVELGWRTPDHAGLKTEERYGVWYGTFRCLMSSFD
jgi:hypothetical protein